MKTKFIETSIEGANCTFLPEGDRVKLIRSLYCLYVGKLVLRYQGKKTKKLNDQGEASKRLQGVLFSSFCYVVGNYCFRVLYCFYVIVSVCLYRNINRPSVTIIMLLGELESSFSKAEPLIRIRV